MHEKGLGIRLAKDRLFTYLVFATGIVIILPFFVVLFHVIREGIASLNLQFIFRVPRPVGEAGGGIVNGIVGTLLILVVATVISVPIGIGGGIYLSEMRTRRLASFSKTAVNVLQGVPSIVIGIVMYTWIVIPLKTFSALAGGVALAIMMLPVVMKSTEETVSLVPTTLRDASLALGAPYYKTILRVVLPTSFSGILSGVMLAVARVAGETAPLLFTAFGNPYLNVNVTKPMAAIPLIIYDYAKSPYQDWIQKAWGASFVLIAMVLALNLVVRLRRPKDRV